MRKKWKEFMKETSNIPQPTITCSKSKNISHLALVFILLILSKKMPAGSRLMRQIVIIYNKVSTTQNEGEFKMLVH